MSKQTVSNEYVSAFCLEMSLLLHAGIGIEDGLYLLIEDEKDKKSKKMLEQLADLVTEGETVFRSSSGGWYVSEVRRRYD